MAGPFCRAIFLSVLPLVHRSFRASSVPSVRPFIAPSYRPLHAFSYSSNVFIFFTNAKLHISISSVTISHQGNVVRITFSSQCYNVAWKVQNGVVQVMHQLFKTPGAHPPLEDTRSKLGVFTSFSLDLSSPVFWGNAIFSRLCSGMRVAAQEFHSWFARSGLKLHVEVDWLQVAENMKWFHNSFEGMTEDVIPPGKWFCPG